MARSLATVGIRVDAISSIDHVLDAVTKAMVEERPWIMTFANPATAVWARREGELKCYLREFDLVAPDGIGMVMAMRLLHKVSSLRVSFDGTSLAPHIFELATTNELPIALVGAKPGIAETAQSKVEQTYPGIKIVGALDGYAQEDGLVENVAALNPRIVVAGMGVAAQERFLLKLVERGWTGIGFTCGGYLDQLAAKGISYYPQWVDRGNLRWAYRLAKEPRRLWRRYLLDYPIFGAKLCRDYLIRDVSHTVFDNKTS